MREALIDDFGGATAIVMCNNNVQCTIVQHPLSCQRDLQLACVCGNNIIVTPILKLTLEEQVAIIVPCWFILTQDRSC